MVFLSLSRSPLSIYTAGRIWILLAYPILVASSWTQTQSPGWFNPMRLQMATLHGEFLRLLFLQAHREATAHFTALGMPAQQHCGSFRYRGVLQWLEEQSGSGCESGSFAGQSQHQRLQHRSSPGSFVTVFARLPHRLCPLSQFAHATRSLVRGGPTRPHRARLVASHSTRPLSSLSSRAQLLHRSCSNKQQLLGKRCDKISGLYFTRVPGPRNNNVTVVDVIVDLSRYPSVLSLRSLPARQPCRCSSDQNAGSYFAIAY